MNDLTKKINHLKWLNKIGIKYYYSTNLNPSYITPVLKPIVEAPMTITNLPEPIYTNDDPVTVARKLADDASDLATLKQAISNFNGCELKNFATNIVFGDGNPNADIMLIGEAPGSSEDKTGIPFCGESGMLLDNILKSINITRQNNAYITNTVFWRPPANRTPLLNEIEVCRPFVEKHIALINPKIIILVGSTAVTSLFGKHSGITKIRQEYYSYSNKYLQKPITTTSIFHPAYLLRQPSQKKTTWYDLIKIQQYINQHI